MRLSSETYERIIESLRPEPPDAALPRDKRLEPRAGVRGFVSIIPPTGGAPIHVPVRNLSHRGIGILCSHPMWPGEQFVVLLAGDDGSTGIIFSVVYCLPLDPDHHAIGGRMVRMSTRT